MNKKFADLTDEEKKVLYGPKIPLWWIIKSSSGGHKSISNIQGLNFLWDDKDKIMNEIIEKIFNKLQIIRKQNA